jgi:hypothetical protein
MSVDTDTVNFLIVSNSFIDMTIKLTIKLEEISRYIILFDQFLKRIMNQRINNFKRKPNVYILYGIH